MANGKLLRQLIRSGAEGDLDAFRNAAKEVVADERQKQHHLLANDLETILYGRGRTPSSPALRNLVEVIPEDRERGIPLLSLREPVRRIEDVVLSRDNLSLVNEILREHNREEVLKTYGLRPSDRILFCGPPGCGKTLTAEVIASELGRPFAVVRNHEGMLDSAVWRRFDEVLFLKPPTRAQLCRLLGVKLRGIRRDFDVREIAERDMLKGATHADVERIVRRALKEMVIKGGELRLNVDHLEAALRRESARKQRSTRR